MSEKRFDLAMTISEHDTKQVQCPHCKSTEVEPQLQAFFANDETGEPKAGSRSPR